MPPQERLLPHVIRKRPQSGVETPRHSRPTYELVAIGAGFQQGGRNINLKAEEDHF